jgi:hypothetical protein
MVSTNHKDTYVTYDVVERKEAKFVVKSSIPPMRGIIRWSYHRDDVLSIKL